MTFEPEQKTRRMRTGLVAAVVALAGLCTPALAEDFDLNALIAAAKAACKFGWSRAASHPYKPNSKALVRISLAFSSKVSGSRAIRSIKVCTR